MHDAGISIVIPVYNGERTIGELVEKLVKVLSDFGEYEIILVDDSSSDGSFEIIKKLALEKAEIIGISLDGNYGQQSAILCGLNNASMEYTVIMDDDLEHDPRDIPALFMEIKRGCDVVYAINSNKGGKPLVRSLGSKLRDTIFNMLTEKPKDVKVCSFRIMNRTTADSVVKAGGGFVYISMEILRHTKNIRNIEVSYGQRGRSGHSLVKLAILFAKIYFNYSRCRLFNRFRSTGPAYGIRAIV